MSQKTISNPVALGLVALGILRRSGKLKELEEQRAKAKAAAAAVVEEKPAQEEAAPAPEPQAAPDEEAAESAAAPEEAPDTPEAQLVAADAPSETPPPQPAASRVELPLPPSPPPLPPPPVDIPTPLQRQTVEPPPPPPSEPASKPAVQPVDRARRETVPPPPDFLFKPAPRPRTYPVTDAVKAILFTLCFVVYLIIEVLAAMLAYMYLNLRHVETFGYLVSICRELLNRFATALERFSPELANQAYATLLGELGPKSVLLLFLGLIVSALLRFLIWSLHWGADRSRASGEQKA